MFTNLELKYPLLKATFRARSSNTAHFEGDFEQFYVHKFGAQEQQQQQRQSVPGCMPEGSPEQQQEQHLAVLRPSWPSMNLGGDPQGTDRQTVNDMSRAMFRYHWPYA